MAPAARLERGLGDGGVSFRNTFPRRCGRGERRAATISGLAVEQEHSPRRPGREPLWLPFEL